MLYLIHEEETSVSVFGKDGERDLYDFAGNRSE
jgi:hypothetical protein